MSSGHSFAITAPANATITTTAMTATTFFIRVTSLRAWLALDVHPF
jgi:hypothetical protein